MKMRNLISSKTIAVAVVAGLALLASCNKNNESPLGSTDSENVNSESVASSTSDETADMSSSVVAGVSDAKLNEGSRIAGHLAGILFDARLEGAIITITPSDSSSADKPSGLITIDFGTGQTVNGVTRKGVINIVYVGLRWVNGSYRTLTYSDYSRNGIGVEGTYTITNVSSDSTTTFTFHHVFTGGTLTFPDNTTVTRSADYLVVWNFSDNTISIENSGVSPSASGSTRKVKDYSMDIVTALVYKASCLSSRVYIPVSGEKTITVGSNNATIAYDINYGDGTCDNTVTVTVGGKTVTITASSSGN